MRVCVVGAGSIGREFALNHFQPSATQTRVACIVDTDEERASALAIDVGSVLAGAQLASAEDLSMKKYRSKPSEIKGEAVPYFTALSADALALCDIVYVGTTPNSHRSLTLAAVSAGKHVILEKPLAATSSDADAIVTACEGASGVVTSMNIGMRWNAAIKTMRTMIEDKSIGEVKSARMKLGFITWPRIWQRVQWCAERAQGGALREVGTHFFFGINELFGHGCVERCKCTVTYDDGDDGRMAETAADGILVLKSGIELSLSLELGLDRDVYELEVEGETGTLLLDGFTTLKKKGDNDPLVKATYGRRECIESLVRAVNGDDASDLISPRQARNAQRLLDAILSSNGEWIDISYD